VAFLFDFSEATPNRTADIPEGQYIVKVISATPPTKTKADSKYYSTTVAMVVDEGPFKGSPVVDYLTMHPGIFAGFLSALRIPFKYEANQQVDEKQWVGKKLLVTLKYEEYNGNTNLKVKGRAVAPLAESGAVTDLAALAAAPVPVPDVPVVQSPAEIVAVATPVAEVPVAPEIDLAAFSLN